MIRGSTVDQYKTIKNHLTFIGGGGGRPPFFPFREGLGGETIKMKRIFTLARPAGRDTARIVKNFVPARHATEEPHREASKIVKHFAPARPAREEPQKYTAKILTNFDPARPAGEEPHR